MRRLSMRDLIDLPKMTATHRRLALHRMADIATERGLVTLVAYILVAIGEQRKAIALEQRWRELDGGTAVHGEGARDKDAELDRALSGLHESLLLIVRSFHGPRAENAQKLLDICFPQGAVLLTSLPYIDEHAAVQGLLEKLLASDNNAALSALGLTAWSDLLRDINESYGALLVKSEPVTYASVQQTEKESQAGMFSVVARILGAYPDDTDADIEARSALLQPIEEQEDALAQLRARKKSDSPPQAAKEQGTSSAAEASETAKGASSV